MAQPKEKRPGLLDEMDALERRRKDRKKKPEKDDRPDLDLGRIG